MELKELVLDRLLKLSALGCRHTLTLNQLAGLWRDLLVKSDLEESTIKCLHSDWLHLDCIFQTYLFRKYQIISDSSVADMIKLLELDNKISWRVTCLFIAFACKTKYRVI